MTRPARKLIFLIGLFFLLSPFFVFAQGEIIVSPTIIDKKAEARDILEFSVKLKNLKNSKVDIYPIVNDISVIEGRQEFLDPTLMDKSISLARWVRISRGVVELWPGEEKEIPFSVYVNLNAQPGKYYAAILVGTRPMERIEGTVIQVSSLVASLIMLNIQGKVIEEGRIREFSTEETFYQKPEVKFTVRFENLGNVHVQPQGEIKIYNFFGKERGIIPINQKTDFGNVLPKSIRKWNFQWKGEHSFFEVGRYKAVLVLGYGEEAHHTVSNTLHFWVVPLKPTLGILGGLTLFILLIIFALRAYIKRAIFIAQKKAGLAVSNQVKWLPKVTDSVIDLRAIVKGKKGKKK